jgi:hypothetical protein
VPKILVDKNFWRGRAAPPVYHTTKRDASFFSHIFYFFTGLFCEILPKINDKKG